MARPSPPAVGEAQPPQARTPSCGQSSCPIDDPDPVDHAEPRPLSNRLQAGCHGQVPRPLWQESGSPVWRHLAQLPSAQGQVEQVTLGGGCGFGPGGFSSHPAASEGRGPSSSSGLWLRVCPWSVQRAEDAPVQRACLLSWNGAAWGSFPPLWASPPHTQLCPRSPPSTRRPQPLVPSPRT